MSPEVPKFYTNPKVGMKYFKFTKNEKQSTQIKTKMNMNQQNMGINRSKYIKIFSKNAVAKMKRRQERRSLFDAMNHHRSQEIKEYQNSELLETVQEIQRQRQWQKENKQKRSESPSLKKNNSFNTFEVQKPPKSRVVYQRVKDIPRQLGVDIPRSHPRLPRCCQNSTTMTRSCRLVEMSQKQVCLTSIRRRLCIIFVHSIDRASNLKSISKNMRQIKASPSLRSNSLGTSLCKLKKKYEGSKENYTSIFKPSHSNIMIEGSHLNKATCSKHECSNNRHQSTTNFESKVSPIKISINICGDVKFDNMPASTYNNGLKQNCTDDFSCSNTLQPYSGLEINKSSKSKRSVSSTFSDAKRRPRDSLNPRAAQTLEKSSGLIKIDNHFYQVPINLELGTLGFKEKPLSRGWRVGKDCNRESHGSYVCETDKDKALRSGLVLKSRKAKQHKRR
ncbi:unnamed protein product [Moneuplotes crassus]|uniref:Uncharacterized protein n=1 Tax=Euplotes crassus TaxID=5936 RepID=A0AAD2D929_EUPCR|nr:unnamed protein product [Moneuplotes crassus]